VLIKLFRQLSRLTRYTRILVKILVFERVLGHFERKYQGDRGSSINDFGIRKLYSPWAITWCCLRDVQNQIQ